MEFRCDNNNLFAVLEDDVIEFKCRNRRCGYEAGTVILHQFDLKTGKLKGTQQFKDPAYLKGVNSGGLDNHPSSLWTA